MDSLSAADRRSLETLLKNPSKFGTVLLYSEDYAKRKDISKTLAKSKTVHEINVTYPGRRFLTARLTRFVNEKGMEISQGVAEYCVDRLGILYSEYSKYADAFTNYPNPTKQGRKPEVTRDIAREALRGVDGLTLDDFMERLVKPLATDALSPNTKLFKAYRAALDALGARRLLSAVLYRVKQYAVLRSLIDEGLLPSGIEYTAESVQKRLGDPPEKPSKEFNRYSILNWGDYKLRKEADLAAKTSIADWLWLKMVLSRPVYSETEAETVLFAAMTRSRLQASTLTELAFNK